MSDGNNNPDKKGPTKGDTTAPAPEAESTRADGAVDDLERLLETGETGPQAQPQGIAKLHELLVTLIGLVKQVFAGLGALDRRITGMAQDIGRLKTDDSVLTDMSAQCRELREQHHERNVLTPMFLALIAVACRCRQAVGRLQRILDKHQGGPESSVVTATRKVLEARNADRIDVENLLADYGVESFVNVGDEFKPPVQKCIRREPCEDDALDGHVAERLVPGYRRFDNIIRQEYVSVYETGGRSGRLNQGERE